MIAPNRCAISSSNPVCVMDERRSSTSSSEIRPRPDFVESSLSLIRSLVGLHDLELAFPSSSVRGRSRSAWISLSLDALPRFQPCCNSDAASSSNRALMSGSFSNSAKTSESFGKNATRKVIIPTSKMIHETKENIMASQYTGTLPNRFRNDPLTW
jgi:hypothetical protein